jgi:hypothetical protein
MAELTLILRPTADVSVSLTPSAAVNHYTLLDEAVLDEADYVKADSGIDAASGSATGTDIFTMLNHTDESGYISRVVVTCKAKGLGANGVMTGQVGVRIGSTNYLCTAVNLSSVTSEVSYTLYLNPATSANWSWANIDDLQGVLKLDSAYTGTAFKEGYLGYACSYGYQFYITVYYIPSFSGNLLLGTANHINIEDYASLVASLTTGASLSQLAVHSTQSVYQTITPDDNYSTKYYRFKLYRANNPSQITVGLYATAAGVPTGSVLALATLNVSGITTSTDGEWLSVYVAVPQYLMASGTVYALVISSSTASASGIVYAKYETTDGYAGGNCGTGLMGAWTATSPSADLLFEVWGDWYDTSDLVIEHNILLGTATHKPGVCMHGHAIDLELIYGCSGESILGYISQYDASLLLGTAGTLYGQILVGEPYPCVAHLNLDEPWLPNQVYVIGKSYSGNPCYGHVQDLTRDGYKLGVITDDSIPTDDDCESVGTNVLAKHRLGADRGSASFSHNSSLELLDVINFVDLANIDKDLRVIEYEFEYDNEKGIYTDTVKLVSV